MNDANDSSMTYSDWNQALVDKFFPPATAGAPAYLAVSADVLRDIGDASAVEEFALAVREKYVTQYGAISSMRMREDLRWRPSAFRVPPYVGLLGLFVLAASEMASDANTGVRSSNYYTRLRPLLGLDPSGGAPAGFYEAVALWQDLDHWLGECGGDRGVSTVSTHETFVYVGYPMSQAIFPVRDRRRLPDFFVSAGLEPGQDIPARELLTHMRRWAGPGSGLREVTVSRISDPAWEEMISSILLAEFRNWDGALRDAQGRRRAEISFNIHTQRGGRVCEIYYVPKHPEGFPDEVFVRGSSLSADGGGWYEALPASHLPRDILSLGVSLVADDGTWSFTFEPRPIIPLHASPYSGPGGWVSVRRIHLHEPLRIALRRDCVARVQDYLRRAGTAGTPVEPAGLPAGWILLDHAVVTSALPGPGTGDPDLERILPRLGTSMSFDGGLDLDRDCYLRGEEPVVHLGLEEPGVFQLDENAQRLAAGGLSLRLSDMGLAPGRHRIGLGETSRGFLVTSGDADNTPWGSGELAFVMERHGGRVLPRKLDPIPVEGEPRRGEVRIAGASVRSSSGEPSLTAAPPLLLRRGHVSVLVGWLPGQIAESREPPRPAWLDRISPHTGAQFYEFACPFRAAFALYGAEGDYRAEALDRNSGREADADGREPGDLLTDEAAAAARLSWANAIFSATGAVVIPRSACDWWLELVEMAFAILEEADT